MTFNVRGQFIYIYTHMYIYTVYSLQVILLLDMCKKNLSVLCTLHALCKPSEGWICSCVMGVGRRIGGCVHGEVGGGGTGKSSAGIYPKAPSRQVEIYLVFSYCCIQRCISNVHLCLSFHFDMIEGFSVLCCIQEVCFQSSRFVCEGGEGEKKKGLNS